MCATGATRAPFRLLVRIFTVLLSIFLFEILHSFCFLFTKIEMNFTKLKSTNTVPADNSDSWAHHNVQLYFSTPPLDTIVSLTELRDLAIFRQKVLKAVESTGLRYTKHSSNYQRELDFALRDIGFRIAITTMQSIDSKSINKKYDKDIVAMRRNDYLSHFILRLVYCLTADSRQWFIQQEVDLLRFRLESESSASVKNLLQLYGIATELVNDGDERKEIETITKQLFPVRQPPAGSNEPAPNMDIFKVPFTEATELIRTRKIYLRGGYAYVPYREMTSVIAGKFRSSLSRSLTTASKYGDIIQADARLSPILQLASTRPAPVQSSDSQNTVTLENIETLVKESFPPCMRVVYKHLDTKHHMRHHGRMQLGLFLKGIGMSMETSLSFWKKKFQPVIGSAEFDSKYAYNIRHNYGKEGKRADYSPFNCMKVVNLPAPGPSDCHGCPFKTMSAELLQQHLQNWGISSDRQSTVVTLAQRGFYDKACTRYFEAQHGLPEDSRDQVITHPNHYFDDSRKIRTGDAV